MLLFQKIIDSGKCGDEYANGYVKVLCVVQMKPFKQNGSKNYNDDPMCTIERHGIFPNESNPRETATPNYASRKNIK